MNGFINREISVVTVLTISLYGLVYVFQRSYSNFWGYPVEFITVDLNMMLKTTLGIFLVVYTVSHTATSLYTASELGFKAAFALVVVIYTIMMSLNAGLKSVFFNSNDMASLVRGSVFGFSCSIVIVFFLWKKIRSYKTLDEKIRGGALFLGALYMLVYSIGWLSACLNNDVFHDEGSYYLINSYGDYYVVGKCINGKAEFLKVGASSGTYYKSEENDVIELKKCLREAD